MRLTWILLVVLTLSIAPLCSAEIHGVAGGKYAPGPTLGPYSMTPFPFDDRPHEEVSYVDSPLGEEVNFILPTDPLFSLRINDNAGWTAEANSYNGKIYFTRYSSPSSMRLTLPSNTVAFYFYATTNWWPGDYEIRATAYGTSTQESLTQETDALGGATYYGFHADSGEFLTTIELNVVGDLNYGFILGEFGIAKAPELGNTPPVADAGPDQTVEQDSHAGASVTLDGSGSSDFDGDPLTYTWTWDSSSASGVNPTVTLPLGTTTVTLTVSDGQAPDTDTVDITVVDTTPPTIICPVDVTVEQESYDGTVVPLVATATDICDPNPVITSDDLAIYPLGETVVTFTATDASGNIASCSMTVTVVDTTPPTIELFEPDPSVLSVPNHKFVEVVILGIAGDICDADLAIDISVKVIDAEGSVGGPTHETDYEILAVGIEEGEISILVALRAEMSGHGDGRIYEIIATVTDDSGNTATDTVDVIVPHDQGKAKGEGKGKGKK